MFEDGLQLKEEMRNMGISESILSYNTMMVGMCLHGKIIPATLKKYVKPMGHPMGDLGGDRPRRGGKVTLYKDAHVPDGCLPALTLDNGMDYTHGQCWRYIMDAISQARRLIYIIGYSFYHKVRLVQDVGYTSNCTLGDLLKSKSQEVVRVLLLLWDDPTSRNILGYNTDGLMATHDEETRHFFKYSSVQVLLCDRVAGKRHGWMKQQETGKIYAHHQKMVIVDADASSNKRKFISFVGGLDLCDGRYDTPRHQLLKIL
ncbi:hypothetical protein GIB67_014415 [Kingdonia uniflora]|uniref:phospholipase D n=1 Tax=Kingdonia uniflora TaxID=39325 RepID=A0A7J7LYZ1_9MAGN|nr:hypothetical protein GIB67_014415 [Kingdonia uniflora]